MPDGQFAQASDQYPAGIVIGPYEPS